MTRLINAIALVLFFATCSFAQDNPAKTGFDFLKRFEGSWAVISMTPGSSTPTAKGTFKARVMGNNWLLCEQNAEMGTVKFNAIQRIGYDSKTKRYIGSWFDNMMKHVWEYDGELDATGNKLTLNATGPDWTDPSQTKDYRDIYEFKSDSKISTTSQIKNETGGWDTFMIGTISKMPGTITKDGFALTTKVTPFLMFTGKATEAIEHYKTVFPSLKVLSMKKHGAGGPGKEGTIEVADISIAGQQIRVIDSPAVHDFDFTPSFSFFVECESEKQLEDRFKKLSEGGKVMMPLNNYGFSKKFGWTSDKFGVSWQLNLK